jgi:hypothetical protein
MLIMKNTGRLVDNSVPFYEKWQFYVLALASLLSFLVVATNILFFRPELTAGIVWWIVITAFFVSACNILMKTPTIKTRNYVVVATVIGIIFNVSAIFGIISLIVNG